MTSRSDFGAATGGLEVTTAFKDQIKGKTVLITGVSPKSIGESIAEAIVQQAPRHLLIASRTSKNIEAVISNIRKDHPHVRISSIIVELGSQASIRKAVAEIISLRESIDVMINNAAVNSQNYEVSEQGIELQFAVNHIGFFLFTNLLKPVLGTPSRVVNISSEGHRFSPIRFSDYNFHLKESDLPENERPSLALPKAYYDPERLYNAFVAYGQSKTANLLFSLSINEKWPGTVSYAVHPGAIWTNLPTKLSDEAQEFLKNSVKDWKTGDQGAATALVAAFDPQLGTVGDNFYLSDCQFKTPAEWARDREAAERLWKLSEDLVGDRFPQNTIKI